MFSLYDVEFLSIICKNMLVQPEVCVTYSNREFKIPSTRDCLKISNNQLNVGVSTNKEITIFVYI